METPGKIELFGFTELNEFFETLARADQRKVIMDSFRIGGKPLIALSRTLLKAGLKRKSKFRALEKSLGFVPGRGSRSSVFVSAKIGARKFRPHRGFHGHLVNTGTTSRSTRRGFNRGTMPGTGFFDQAFNQTENQMTTESADYILDALNKLVQRNLKKQGKGQ